MIVMAKKLAKKTGTIKPLAKEDEGRSCGIDTLDLFVISQTFSDLYEKSEKKAFKYLLKESKEFSFDPEEMQASLLEGGKRDEDDILGPRRAGAHGYLYGTVGDDEIELNSSGVSGNNPYGDGPTQVNIYGYFGDDTITNNISYSPALTPQTFQVDAWGGSGLDHFYVRKSSLMRVRDMEEGETITITDLSSDDEISTTGEAVVDGRGFRRMVRRYFIEFREVDMVSPNLVLEDMGRTEAENGTFSHTWKAVELIQGNDGTDAITLP